MTETHTPAAGRRTGGRAGRAAARAAAVVDRVPYLTRTMRPYEIATDEALATIEHTADAPRACSALSLIQNSEFVPQFGEPGKPFICFDTTATEVPEEPEVSA